jgi:osmoprotectant transport system ATP-binding protein
MDVHAMSAALEFRNIFVEVASGRLLLNDVSLALEEGTVTAILGRSGSGKTTLLRSANRMIQPTSGQVYVAGTNIDDISLVQLRRKMGYVIQETGLFPHINVARNVGIVLEAEGQSKESRTTRSNELLQLVGLDPATFSQRFPHQLAGGQRQRVGLARALAAQPKTLLMDEPFGALDPLTRAEMQDMLRDLLKSLRTTVLLVTHDLDEALYLAHRIVLLGDGKVLANLRRDQFLQSEQPEIIAYARAVHLGPSNAYSDPKDGVV